MKLEIVLEYLKGQKSAYQLAREYGITKGDIQKWRDAYLANGIKGITTAYTYGRYSGDFKVAVVEYMRETGASYRKTAAHFNIRTHATVSKWERIYEEQGPEALYTDRRGIGNMGRKPSRKPLENPPDNESLLEEIKRLRMENEYLKKLNALVQKREKSAKKIK